MSLIFHPRRFKDKNGDIIEIQPIDVSRWELLNDTQVIWHLNDSPLYMTETCNEDFQRQLEWRWDMYMCDGQTGPQREWFLSKARNLSHELRDKIKILECIMEAKGKDWTITEQMQLEVLREKLGGLSEEQ